LEHNPTATTITGCDIGNDRFGSDLRPFAFQLRPEVISIEEQQTASHDSKEECGCSHLPDHGDKTERIFGALQKIHLTNTDEYIIQDDVPLWHDVHNGDTSQAYAASSGSLFEGGLGS
jgi:hypothetical protein